EGHDDISHEKVESNCGPDVCIQAELIHIYCITIVENRLVKGVLFWL
ncbi:11214_t:CDS:1, partial [Diversispora eburnea]